MNWPEQLARSLFGPLIQRPSLLQSSDLRDVEFAEIRLRKTFQEISRIWAEDHPEGIDTRILAERLGGTAKDVAFVASLLDGNTMKTELEPDRFNRRVREFRVHVECWKMSEEAKAGQDNPAKIRGHFQVLQELEYADDGEDPEAIPTSLMLSDVESKSVPWLWQNFFARGRATLISGDPGSAKTWFLLDLAARHSRGQRWPDGAPGDSVGARTYYMTVEDDLHDTIRPRIDSLGGNPAKIAVFNSEHPLHLNLSEPDGLVRLEKELVRLGNIDLVVIDPIIDFSGKSNPNAAEEVRSLLTPLIRLALKLNFALVLIGHLNKAQTLSAIYRAGGSALGWLGKCRAAFMIFRDKDDPALRHVYPVKANLAPQDPPQLHFRIINGEVKYEVSREDVNIDEQLAPRRGPGPDPTECNEAIAWINKLFAEQVEIPSAEVEEAAAAEGISETTLQRAKKKLGFRSKRLNESGERLVWTWVKPAKVA